MSRAAQTIEVEYPESDGLPMAESDPHRRWMFRVIHVLEHRYRDDPNVYVSGNMLLYYVEGNPKKHLSPDAFVVKDCEKHDRPIFKTWAEQRVPNVVFELASKTTRRRDKREKPEMYSRIGVAEYFQYDHTGGWLKPPLQGLRLVDGVYEPIESDVEGRIHSEELGLFLERDEFGDLLMRDAETGEVLLTEAEAAQAQADAAQSQAAALQEDLRARDAEIERLRRLLGENDARE